MQAQHIIYEPILDLEGRILSPFSSLADHVGVLSLWAVCSADCCAYLWPSYFKASREVYVGLNAYRAYSDTSFLALAKPRYANIDNYHYWQMNQLNTILSTDPLLQETLDELRTLDPYWESVDIRGVSPPARYRLAHRRRMEPERFSSGPGACPAGPGGLEQHRRKACAERSKLSPPHLHDRPGARASRGSIVCCPAAPADPGSQPVEPAGLA